MRWTIGRVTITKVVELETIGHTRFILPLAGREEIQRLPWLIPHFATEDGRLKMSIHALVVETPTRRIVVDTGLGNDKQHRTVPTWNDRKGPFLDDLTAAGFPPDSIDTVLCTHLHVDHVGWNTRLERRPMGADLREGALSVRPGRIRLLARSQHGARQGGDL